MGLLVLVGAGDYARGSTQGPTITVSTGSVANSYKAVDDDSGTTIWVYVLINGNASCNSSTGFSGSTSYIEGNDVTYTADNNGKKICFRSTDTANNAGYGATPVLAFVTADTTDPPHSRPQTHPCLVLT